MGVLFWFILFMVYVLFLLCGYEMGLLLERERRGEWKVGQEGGGQVGRVYK